jgi:hypothetical protein
MTDQKHVTLQVTPEKGFLTFKGLTRREWGRKAVIGLLAGFVLESTHILIVGIIGDVFSIVGLIAFFVWVYLHIARLYKFIMRK